MPGERFEPDFDPPQLPFDDDDDCPEMVVRHEQMTAQQRVELFERMSRDAAWARSAKRIR